MTQAFIDKINLDSDIILTCFQGWINGTCMNQSHQNGS